MPNKDLACIPNKEVACVPSQEKKQVVLVPGTDAKQVVLAPGTEAKQVVLVPGSEAKQLAPVPKKELALVPAPKLDVCVNFRLPSACYTCNLSKLPRTLRTYVEEQARLCQPETIHLCDGSDIENLALLKLLQQEGRIQKLEHMNNCWLACTDPKDVARVESRTFISTARQIDTVAKPLHGRLYYMKRLLDNYKLIVSFCGCFKVLQSRTVRLTYPTCCVHRLVIGCRLVMLMSKLRSD